MAEALRRIGSFLGFAEPGSQLGQAATFDSQYQNVIDDIDKLAKLPTGWNTYRAEAVPFYARRRAIDFIEALHKLRVPVPVPSVSPTSNGGVALRWETDAREVLVIFLSEGGEFSISDADDHVIAGGSLDKVDLLRDVVPQVFVS